MCSEPALVHRALAADHVDAELAQALEAAAGRDDPGAGAVSARRLLVWAADLSTGRADRERRLLLAALQDVYSPSDEAWGEEVWARVEDLPPSALRSCALAGRALAADRVGAAVVQVRAARRAFAARSGELRAGWRSFVAATVETLEAAIACRLARGADAVEAAGRALAADSGDGDRARVRTARRLLLMGRTYVDGPHAVLRSLEAPEAAADLAADPGLLLVRGECLILAGKLEAGARDLNRLVALHDASRAHPDRLSALERLVITDCLLGLWQDAEAAMAELVDAGGEATVCGSLRAMLRAARGTRVPRARQPASATDPDRVVLAAVADVIGMLALGAYADVLATLARVTADTAGLADAPAKFAPLWLPACVEAAVETGDWAAYEDGAARLREVAERLPHLRPVAQRLANRAGRRLQRARRQEADSPAEPSGRTRAEPSAEAALTALTEREATVAALIASGMTNSRAAAELQISAKAVEYHLRRIYRKLGVRTRSEFAERWRSA